MATGTVKTVMADKGFGFITPDESTSAGNSDLFFHHTAIQEGQIEQYQPGDRVSFQVEPDSKNPSRMRATNVTRLAE